MASVPDPVRDWDRSVFDFSFQIQKECSLTGKIRFEKRFKSMGAVAKTEDKQPCKGGRTKPGVNRLKVCAAPGIDKKNNIKPCKGDRIKFVQAVFSNAPTELQG